jgi:predicted RNase H-like nuclease (RuvC/YqgF family)
MMKKDAIKLLEDEGWTNADALRALKDVVFDTDPDELAIRRVVSSFAGPELIKRQRLQAAQKGQVTKKSKDIELKDNENKELEIKTKTLVSENEKLIEVNDRLKKDNKDLKNIVDRIKLQIALDVKKLMHYEDSEIRKALAKWFKGSQG